MPAPAETGRPKAEVNRLHGKVNFTRDDVQAYYDMKLVGGMSPDEAAKATGVKFGLKITVNPVGDVQVPDIPPKAYGALGGPPAEPAPIGPSPAVAVAPPPPEPKPPQPVTKKTPLPKGKMQGKRPAELPPDEEPEAPLPSQKVTAANEPGHEESAYDTFGVHEAADAVGTAWDSVAGKRTVTGVHATGKLLVSTEGQRLPVLLAPSDLPKEIALDTKQLASRQKMQAQVATAATAAAAAKAADDDTDGFADTLPPMQRARAIAALQSPVRSSGKVWKRRDLIRQWVRMDRAVVKPHPKFQSILEKPGGGFLTQADLTATGVAYARHLAARAHESQSVTSFLVENPEFANPDFAAWVGGRPDQPVEEVARDWWAQEYRRRVAETGSLVPAFPAVLAAIQEETVAWCRDPATALHWTLAEYRRRGGEFLTEQRWAAEAIKRPGFWKKMAPFAQQPKDFTDPTIPLDVHLQVARRHPQGLRGALSAIQMFLNLGQAGPKAQAQLEKIKARYQGEITANAERREAEVKRTRERFATA